MKQKILLCLVAGVLRPVFNARAVQGGAGHYIPGQFADFSGMPLTQPGFYFGNYFHDYDNGTFGASKELPFGGIFAAGVTANVQAEVPLALDADPFSFQDITISSGIAVPFCSDWNSRPAPPSIAKCAAFGCQRAINQRLGRHPVDAHHGRLDQWRFQDRRHVQRLGTQRRLRHRPTGQPRPGLRTFEPMLAFSWLSSKIGTEFTVYNGVDFNTENTDVSYQSATFITWTPRWRSICRCSEVLRARVPRPSTSSRSPATAVPVPGSAVSKLKLTGLGRRSPTSTLSVNQP